MKTKAVLILIILSLAVALTGCSSPRTPNEPPNISITIDDQEVDYVIGKNIWNGAIYDRQDTFIVILEEGSNITPPYVELGKRAVIDFGNYPPDTLKIQDYILNENGHSKYTYREILEITPKIKKGKVSFDIGQHWAASLSSNSADYEKGAVIRGFRITCSWNDNACEYAFIIKTDAS